MNFIKFAKKDLAATSGFSLLEIIVATSLFATVMIISTGIFQGVIEGQRGGIAAQNIQESLRYAYEVMSKEIRMAKKSDDSCYVMSEVNGKTRDYNPAHKVFNTVDSYQQIYFKNKDGQCVTYYISGDQLFVHREGVTGSPMSITPDEIAITTLNFSVVDDAVGEFHSVQPVVTIKTYAETTAGKEMNKQKIDLQTTVSSRYYE